MDSQIEAEALVAISSQATRQREADAEIQSLVKVGFLGMRNIWQDSLSRYSVYRTFYDIWLKETQALQSLFKQFARAGGHVWVYLAEHDSHGRGRVGELTYGNMGIYSLSWNGMTEKWELIGHRFMLRDGRELSGPLKNIVNWDVNHSEGQLVKMKALGLQEFRASPERASYTCVGDRYGFCNVGFLKVDPGWIHTSSLPKSQEGIIAIPKQRCYSRTV